MDDQIRDLACARAAVQELRGELREARHALDNSPPAIRVAQLKRRVSDMMVGCYDLENEIRMDAQATFRRTREKQPHLAVHVKINQRANLYTWNVAELLVDIDDDLSAYLGKEE